MTLLPGQRVRVHRNLHKAAAGAPDQWSVADPKTGRVLAHVARVALRGIECRVQEGGRQTVLAKRQRSVHAYVVGELVAVEGAVPARDKGMARFSYNPYKSGTFYAVDGGAPVREAEAMRFDEEGAWYR